MKIRIMLVEDNSANIYLATFLLEQRGFQVELAHNGAECLGQIKEAAPALVLMDLHMPVMDGYEAARALLADPATAAIPIIAVTAYAMPGDRAKALAIGFRDYIEKPFDPTDFADRVAAHLPGIPP